MTGGAICPPLEATASIAPAKRALKPDFFMSGIVTIPVDMMLPIAVPLIEPKMLEATTATLAGPPRLCPMPASARSVKNFVAPLTSIRRPSTTNASTSVPTTVMTRPGMPFVSAYTYITKVCGGSASARTGAGSR